MKKILPWIFFLPLGYAALYISFSLIFFSLSFLFFWLSGLSVVWRVVASLSLFMPIFTIATLLFFGASMIASFLSPNKYAYWVVAAVFLIPRLSSFLDYCHDVSLPDNNGAHTLVQLPCWAYVAIGLLQTVIILMAGFANKK